MSIRQAQSIAAVVAAVSLQAMFNAPAQAAWPLSPYLQVPVALTGLTQTRSVIVSDGAGGAIVGWLDRRAGNFDVYAQHLDAAGDIAAGWPALGVPLCTTTGDQSQLVGVADGQGGAIFAWRDLRSGTQADIYVTRISSTGVIVPGWPVNGRQLVQANQVKDENTPRIIADGSGGAVIVWTLVFTPGSDEDIYGAHVNAIGAIDWCTGLYTPGGLQNQPSIASASPGSFTVAFSDGTIGGGDVRVQTYATSGAFQWSVILSNAEADLYPLVTADGTGGSFITWFRATGGGAAEVLATRLTSSGGLAALWVSSGTHVGSGAVVNPYSPEIPQRAVSDGAGGLFVFWSTGTLYVGYAQHLSPIGTSYPSFPLDGKLAFGSDLNQGVFLDAIGDGRGGVYVAGMVSSGTPAVSMRRLDENGNVAPGWKGGSTTMVSGALDLFSSWWWLGSDPDGRALFTQLGFPSGNTEQVVAQVVDRFGRVGNVAPAISAVRDVSGDQGGHVRLDWSRSPLDASPAYEIESYWIWRQAPAAAAQAAVRAGATLFSEREATAAIAPANATPTTTPRMFRRAEVNGVTYWWELVATASASGFSSYSYVASTTRDSMASGNPRTPFLVQARHRDGYAFWDSPADSGYSVDNLAPSPPNPFTGAFSSGTTTMTWGASDAPDLAYYRLHRGASAGFVPDASNLVTQTTTTSYADHAGPLAYYKLAAVDIHGNLSGYASLGPDNVVGVSLGTQSVALALEAPTPQPARDVVHLRFALPERAEARLAIFDVSGRLVADLAHRTFEPGVHDLPWRAGAEGRVPGGVYFAKLTTLGRTIEQRVVLIH